MVATLCLAATLSLGTLSSCGPTRPPRGLDNPNLVVGPLATVNPLDIVVLPITNNTGRDNLPVDEIRKSFHAGLVRQRYSPLSLTYVDERVVDAAYAPGTLQEQAILQVIIHEWDDTQWSSRQRLRIAGEVYLLDARNPDPRQPLWGGKVDRRVDLFQDSPGLSSTSVAISHAVQRFAGDVLASLPPRDPERVPAR